MAEKPYDPDDRYNAMFEVVSVARSVARLNEDDDQTVWWEGRDNLRAALRAYDRALDAHAARLSGELAGGNPDASSPSGGYGVGSALPTPASSPITLDDLTRAAGVLSAEARRETAVRLRRGRLEELSDTVAAIANAISAARRESA